MLPVRPISNQLYQTPVWLLLLTILAFAPQIRIGCSADKNEKSACKSQQFQHYDFRCKCECKLAITPSSQEPLQRCQVNEVNYDAGENATSCGRETCIRCPINQQQHRAHESCNYVVVVSDPEACFCENVLPQETGANVTRAYVTDCELCSCVFEERSQTLVKVAVITICIGTVIAFVIAIFFPRVPNEELT